jgi:hypothetical protein
MMPRVATPERPSTSRPHIRLPRSAAAAAAADSMPTCCVEACMTSASRIGLAGIISQMPLPNTNEAVSTRRYA